MAREPHILHEFPSPVSDSQALLMRPLELGSVKFSTSKPGQSARSGVFSPSVRLGELLHQT